MITLKKVYLEPDTIGSFVFEPIVFERGINVVLGNSSSDTFDSTQKDKMNGVGKSMLMEIIDFCMLKDLDKSRINRLPLPLIDERTLFCLDLEYSTQIDAPVAITIKRPRLKEGSLVTIVVDGEDKDFESLSDARLYLERYFVMNRNDSSPSLRQLLSILIRDEKTIYGDIFYTDASSKQYSYTHLLKPHLYLFGFELAILSDIAKDTNEQKRLKKVITQVTGDFKLRNVALKEVRSYLSDLEDRISKLDLAIENLAPGEASSQKKDELASLLTQLDELTTAKAAKEYLLKKIGDLPKPKPIEVNELRNVYNAYKNGLGDIVVDSFEKVLEFRREVEEFQHDLAINKQKEVRDSIASLNVKIHAIDKRIAAIYKTTDAKRKIDDLTDAVVKQREAHQEFDDLSGRYKLLQEKKGELRDITKALDAAISSLEAQLFELEKTVLSFEEDLKNVHEAVAGNRYCEFQLKVDPSSAHYLDVNYRIKLDGSAGIERIKTFMYDVLLMVNKFTNVRHPGFLIHDNIFAPSGTDDMVKALNYLAKLEVYNDGFQYIVTINEDEFDSAKDRFSFDFDSKVRKTLTREAPLFGEVYSEIK